MAEESSSDPIVNVYPATSSFAWIRCSVMFITAAASVVVSGTFDSPEMLLNPSADFIAKW